MPNPYQRFRVVLVEPQYEINVGAVARAMKNFGFSELFLVNPKCDHLGIEAIKHSKHASEILENASVCSSLAQATKGCDLVVGTTGVLYRHWHKTFRFPISIKQLKSKIKQSKKRKIALLFGNEGTGLSEEHISSCDLLATIPSNPAYPVLNLSHAAAIVLYELSDLPLQSFLPAQKGSKEQLLGAFFSLVDRYARQLRNPNKTKVAFRRLVGKSMLAEKECATLLGVLRRALRELESK
ncbi:MAG: RNA methyltransferase [Candidatus Micrarchaeota archaeon]|nr:RNA methyltransferase [Candidatus Micrarchaeota archaeon]